MKPSGWRTAEELLAERLKDPEFREAWAATLLAHSVALRVIGYRIDHGLSQTALAEKLGMKQPAVSRLEIGETNPSIDTLRRLASVLGMEFLISIAPSERPKLIGKEAARAEVAERIESGGSHLLIAAC